MLSKKDSGNLNRGEQTATLDLFLLMNKNKQVAVLKLLSAQEILEQSHGEIQNPETLNYKNMKPVRYGLFCEEIFGPINDYECSCGKYNGVMYDKLTCPECNVLVTKSHVRRERKAHITFVEPVLHPWFLASVHNPICLLLDIKHKVVLSILNESLYCVVDEEFSRTYKLIFGSYQKLLETYDESVLLTGIKCLERILLSIDLPTLLTYLVELKVNLKLNKQRLDNVGKRIAIVSDMIKIGNRPENIILKVLPVLPAGLRNIVFLDSGLPGTTDINQLYKIIIIRNKRLEMLKRIYVPELILSNSRQLLQSSVNWLFINSYVQNPVKLKGKVMKCLTDFIKGKKGMLRSNLLGRRVNFTARSVIIVDNSIQINECGIPKIMALELFKPFIARELLKEGKVSNLRESFVWINEQREEVWLILNRIVKQRMVILNRAPTLHINSMQAFYIKLVDGYAIKIHPLICKGYNADFDGDQMSVHLQILPVSNIETRLFMYSIYNGFSPSNGKPLIEPVREIILGLYAASQPSKVKVEGLFLDINAVECAVANESIRLNDSIDYWTGSQVVETTPGTIKFNQLLPESLRRYDLIITGDFINELIYKIDDQYGSEYLAKVLDQVKVLGLEFCTKLGISMSLDDIIIPDNKQELISSVEREIDALYQLRKHKLISVEQLDNMILARWSDMISSITENIKSEMRLNSDNDLYLASNSKARGSLLQVRQLGGIRGIVSDAQGNIVPSPIIPSYKEGLNSLDQFLSAYGTRKGIIDKNFKTAISGYLTRKLVSLTQSIVVREFDCGTSSYTLLEDISSVTGHVKLPVAERLVGRTLFEGVLDLEGNSVLRFEDVNYLQTSGIDLTTVKVRTLFDCQSSSGCCALCYGHDIAKRSIVSTGKSVGILAAQALGEPALQMTLRTFHSGGISSFEESIRKICSKNSGILSLVKGSTHDIKSDTMFISIALTNVVLAVGDTTYNIPKGGFILKSPGSDVGLEELIALHDTQFTIFTAPVSGTVTYDSNLCIEHEGDYLVNDRYINLTFGGDDGTRQLKLFSDRKLKLHVGNMEVVHENQIIATSYMDKLVASDIVNDLYQVQSILEVERTPVPAVLALESGTIRINNQPNSEMKQVQVVSDGEVVQEFVVPEESLACRDADVVRKYDLLANKRKDYNDLITKFSVRDVRNILLQDIKSIYMNSNIIIKDVHIELIVNQMLRSVMIVEQNDSKLIPNEIMYYTTYQSECENLLELNLVPPTCRTVVSGLTKSSRTSSSFIASCAFQDTKRLMTEAAIHGAVDKLEGLSENLICGNLLPCGTGLYYKNIVHPGTQKLSTVLSKFLKQVNGFAFANLVSQNLYHKLKANVNFTDQSDWLELIIHETHMEVVGEFEANLAKNIE